MRLLANPAPVPGRSEQTEPSLHGCAPWASPWAAELSYVVQPWPLKVLSPPCIVFLASLSSAEGFNEGCSRMFLPVHCFQMPQGHVVSCLSWKKCFKHSSPAGYILSWCGHVRNPFPLVGLSLLASNCSMRSPSLLGYPFPCWLLILGFAGGKQLVSFHPPEQHWDGILLPVKRKEPTGSFALDGRL